MPTDNHFYLAIQIANYMMSTQKMSNLIGLVRTQNMIMQKMSNLCVCYTDESEPKSGHANKSESKNITVNACYTDERESK